MPEQALSAIVPTTAGPAVVLDPVDPTDGNTVPVTPARTYLMLANASVGLMDGGGAEGPPDEGTDGGGPGSDFDDALDGGQADSGATLTFAPQITVRPATRAFPAAVVPAWSISIPAGSYRLAGPVLGAYVDAHGLAHATWTNAGSTTCQPFTVPQ